MKKLIIILLIAFSGYFSYGQTVTHVVDAKDSLVVTTVTIIPKKPVVQPGNQNPICFAGNSQTIVLPLNGVTLNGTASDPDGNIVSVLWSKTTTNAGGTIATPNSLTTSVSGLLQGSYTFKLTVTDNSGAIASSSVNVIVNGAPPPVDTTGGIKNEGWGGNAIGGGNSSQVISVNTAAQLMAAIGSNRTIKFTTSGTFIVRLDIIGVSYMTIDGNGFDVTLNGNNNGDCVSFDGSNTHHCILKNVHVTNAGNDGINAIDGANNILITNCTSYGNRDGNIDVAGAKNVTVAYCLMGAGTGSAFAGDMLITSTNVTAHHNLYSPSGNGVGERCPFVHCNYSPVGNPNAEVINNVIWKFGRNDGGAGLGSGYGTAIGYNATANVWNNYYYTEGTSKNNATATSDGYGSGATGKANIIGNVSGNSGVNPNNPNNHAAYPDSNVDMQDACTAARLVLQKAGPLGNGRNAVDRGLLSGINLPGCPAQ